MIKLIKSSFYKEIETKRELVEFIMKAEILSMSKECKKYEKAFSEKQQRKYSVFVSSGSGANLILIQALLNLGRVKKGDKIGVSSLTWPTNIMPLIQLGLVPVAVDCELSTLNISSKMLKKRIDNLDGLFLTNVLGFSDKIEEIKEICLEKNIVFIEDNCESLGSAVNGKLLGNFSLASTFSFFVGHHLSTIEGGMICTDDEELCDMLVMVRAHGWYRNLSSEKQQKLRKENNVDDFLAKYTFYDLAYNVRPTEIQGFLGNTQIQYWDEIISKRASNFNRFQRKIENNDDFMPLNVSHMDVISNFAMPVICKSKEIFERYKKKFKDNNVEVRPIIAGDMTQQPFYKKYIKDLHGCENARFIHQNAFYFGNNPELTQQELNLLCDLLEK